MRKLRGKEGQGSGPAVSGRAEAMVSSQALATSSIIANPGATWKGAFPNSTELGDPDNKLGSPLPTPFEP